MRERRQQPRKIADTSIEVRDLNTGRSLGSVVNLTSDGLMLLTPDPVESNLVFQLELKLHRPVGGRQYLQLGAESLWCSDGNEPAHYWVGFHIIDISLDVVEVIESLISAWECDERTH